MPGHPVGTGSGLRFFFTSAGGQEDLALQGVYMYIFLVDTLNPKP